MSSVPVLAPLSAEGSLNRLPRVQARKLEDWILARPRPESLDCNELATAASKSLSFTVTVGNIRGAYEALELPIPTRRPEPSLSTPPSTSPSLDLEPIRSELATLNQRLAALSAACELLVETLAKDPAHGSNPPPR